MTRAIKSYGYIDSFGDIKLYEKIKGINGKKAEIIIILKENKTLLDKVDENKEEIDINEINDIVHKVREN